MITHQPVNNHDDLRKVTDNMQRDAGLTIEDSDGKVNFDGKDPVRKTTMKVGGATAAVLAANAVAEAAIWKAALLRCQRRRQLTQQTLRE